MSGEAMQRFDLGMTYYTEARYREAATALREAIRLGSIVPDWPLAESAHLYLGISLLMAGDPAPARPHLDQAARSNLAPLAEKARWYQAQASLLVDDPLAAEEALVELTTTGLVYRDQAAAQLAELRRLLAETERSE
jgi:hypothetical protein